MSDDWVASEPGSSVTFSVDLVVRRGDVVRTCGDGLPNGSLRVLSSTGTSFTFRHLHRWRWVESLRSAWERYIAWPLADWRTK